MLLSAMLDGQMTAAEESRLADLLRDNPDAQESYLDYCRTHALLRQELGGRCDIAALAGEEAVAAVGSAVEMQSPLGEMGDRRFSGDDPPRRPLPFDRPSTSFRSELPVLSAWRLCLFLLAGGADYRRRGC